MLNESPHGVAFKTGVWIDRSIFNLPSQLNRDEHLSEPNKDRENALRIRLLLEFTTRAHKTVGLPTRAQKWREET